MEGEGEGDREDRERGREQETEERRGEKIRLQCHGLHKDIHLWKIECKGLHIPLPSIAFMLLI